MRIIRICIHNISMVICVCNAVSERDIRFAAQNGCTSFASLRKELGVGTCCGKCKAEACRVLREHRDDLHRSGAWVGAD
jgi:bacterioferritin-associated ferredoxin